MSFIKTPSFTLAVYQQGDSSSEKLALVLPGRLDTKDYVHMRSHVDYLARKGYLAVSFDPPGTWGSQGGIELFTTTNYIKAVNELIGHFGNRQTILLGHSRGGSVSVLAGVSRPCVEAIIPIMAAYGPPAPPKAEIIRDGFFLEYRDMIPGDRETEEQVEIKLPLAYFEDGQKYITSQVLKNCQKSILLIYGTRDEFTKPEKAQAVFASIPGSNKQILELDSGHDYRYKAEMIVKVNEAIGEFIHYAVRFA